MNRSIRIMTMAGLLILVACNPTTTIQVLQPAMMTLPDHIETIAMVDRSKPEKGFLNFLEGLVTGEEIGQDRRGRVNAMRGLADALTRTPRFEVRQTGLEWTGSNSGERYAPPLSWEKIDKICRDYDADAVAAIELFDSDGVVAIEKRTKKEKDEEDNEVEKVYYDATRNITIRIGWRLYDPKTRVILDEFTVEEDFSNYGRGDTEEAARQKLDSQTAISENFGFDAGVAYGMRIAPVYINVQRTFYKSGKGVAKEPMERAARFADANEWLKAAAIWRPLADNPPDNKTGGRAAYNMAVANEVQGRLQSALDWARKAYTYYGDKKGRSYIRVLEQRMNDKRKADMQMKDKNDGA